MNEITAQKQQAIELHQKILVSANLAQQNIWDMCSGLKTMRDNKLYKELGYTNFEDYCENEVGFSREQGRKYISIIENISLENANSSWHLGVSKLYLLSTISEPEQAEIAEKLDLESTTVKQLKAEIEKLKVEKSNLNDEKETLQNSNNYLKTDFKEVCQNKAEVDRLLTKEQNRNSELEAKIKELESRPIEVAVAEPSDSERRLSETIKALERENIKRNDELEAEYRENEKIVRRQLENEKQEAITQLRNEYESRIAELASADSEGKAGDEDIFKAYFSVAYDSFNHMFDFAKQSAGKEYFKNKIQNLIATLSTQNINL